MHDIQKNTIFAAVLLLSIQFSLKVYTWQTGSGESVCFFIRCPEALPAAGKPQRREPPKFTLMGDLKKKQSLLFVGRMFLFSEHFFFEVLSRFFVVEGRFLSAQY